MQRLWSCCPVVEYAREEITDYLDLDELLGEEAGDGRAVQSSWNYSTRPQAKCQTAFVVLSYIQSNYLIILHSF
jgi:hypothetical protein